MVQTTPQSEDFAETFGRLLAESYTSVRRLAHLSGVSRRTLENWSNGAVRGPRHWVPVLRVAHALHLSAAETDALLRAAGLPALASLQAAHLTGSQVDLLAMWPQLPGTTLVQKEIAPIPGHNLPAAATPFFGRERARQELISLIIRPDVRLVTVTGLGGVGKTRLALEAARASADRFDHGAHFIALEAVGSAEAMWEAMATGLNIPRDPLAAPDQLVPDYLHNKNMLLIYDSFEHLSDQAHLLSELMRRSPRLTVLVTSRRALNLRAEHLLPTAGLSLDGQTSSAAYQLFLETARRRVPDYAPAPATESDILAICEAVEGLPLALELAASWVDILPPARILARMQSSLTGVHQPSADRPSRQRSLWSVFDSTFQTLPEDAQQAALRLSVMTADFSTAAALAVGECEPEPLRMLIHSSFVRRLADGRLITHSLVRQFLAEQAANSGLTQHELERAYMTYYLGWAAEQGRALREEMSATAVRRLDVEWSHVDRAWWLAADARRGDLLEAAVDLLIYFEARADWRGGREFMGGARDRLSPDAARARARLDEAQSIMSVRNFDYILAMQLATRALATFEALGVDPATDPAGSYARLTQWALEYRLGQQVGAAEVVEATRAAAGPHLAKFGEMTHLLLQGVRTAFEGDWPGAKLIYDTALERSLPDGYHVPNVRLFVGQALAQLGDIAAARAEFERAWHGGHELCIFAAMVGATFELRYLATDSPTTADCREALLELSKEHSDPSTTCGVALHIAVAYLTQGLFAKAGLLAWVGLSLSWDHCDPSDRAISLFKLANTYLAFGQTDIARTLLSLVSVQQGVDSETQLMATGLLGMLGGTPQDLPDEAQLHLLFEHLVSPTYRSAGSLPAAGTPPV